MIAFTYTVLQLRFNKKQSQCTEVGYRILGHLNMFTPIQDRRVARVAVKRRHTVSRKVTLLIEMPKQRNVHINLLAL